MQPVLDTLVYLKRETNVWFEITTLLIPGENDSDAELEALTQWVMENLGPDVPIHFTAFHPDWKMLNHSPTPVSYTHLDVYKRQGTSSTTAACNAMSARVSASCMKASRACVSCAVVTTDGSC